MTQVTPPVQFATPAEVAALIGVEVSTLPAGPALIEACTATGEYATSSWSPLESFSEAATAYVWRDQQDQKIVEVRVSHKKKKLSYQKIEYNADGKICLRHDQLIINGWANKIYYDKAGLPSHAHYGTDFGGSPADLYQFWDSNGQLHNAAGYAHYFIDERGSLFKEAYYIHGMQYQKEQFEAHPERIAYKENKRQQERDAKWYNRLKHRAKNAFTRTQPVTPVERKATLRSDVLLDIVAQLSDAEKLSLLKAIDNSYGDDNRPSAVRATVTIHAPRREFKASRS